MAEEERKQQPEPVEGIAKARAALTEKDGVLEGNPDAVAENAKSAAGPIGQGDAGETAGAAADGSSSEGR